MRLYPCFRAILIKPLRFSNIIFMVPGTALRASSAPPTTKNKAFPVPSLVKRCSILRLLAEQAPKKGKIKKIVINDKSTKDFRQRK